MTGRVFLGRAASILIATALLLTPFSILLVAGTGGAAPVVEYKGGSISVGSDEEYSYWNITSDVVLTGDLTIGAGGVVTVDHGGIIFSQEDGIEYELIIKDGGKLILKNSTLTTRLNNLQTSIGLGVLVQNGSTLEAYDSVLRFPGHFVVDDSNLTLWRSTIDGHNAGDIASYCSPDIFPTGAFDDAPVLLFMDAEVNLFDSRLEDIYEPPVFTGPHPDLSEMHDYNYSFVSDQHLPGGNRTVVSYQLGSGDYVLDTYMNVTLAGNTALTSVNTYIGVDFSDDPYLHNTMVLQNSSTAYIYGLAVDEGQQASELYERLPAFVTIDGTYEAVVSSVGGADNTNENLFNATVSDTNRYRVYAGETLNFDEFDTGKAVFPITGATLYFQYVTSESYGGSSYVQYSNGGPLGNTNIQINTVEVSFTTESYDLYANGVRTIDEIKELTVQFISNSPTSGQYVDVNRVWIEVTTSPTIYIYRWANVTALDSQGNPVSDAVVSADIEIPSELPAYYYTPSGLDYVPPAEVLKYLGTDAAHFNWTGNDGKVSIPLLSETLNSSRLNPYAVYSYNLTVTCTDGSDAYYGWVGVGHGQNPGNLSWGQYPDLSKGGMSVEAQVYLTNLVFLPDLYVDPTDIRVTSGTVFAGSEATVNITVANIGIAAAAGILVELYDGNRATGGQLIGTMVVSVPAHGTVYAEFTWIPDEIGNYPIYVYINSDRTVLEYNYANNIASKNIAVSIEQDGDYLVIQGDVPLTLSVPLSPAQTVIISGSLTIDGTIFTMQQVGSLKIIVKDDGELRLVNGARLMSTGNIDLYLLNNARLEIIKSTVQAEVKILPYDESTVVALDESTVSSDLSTPVTSSATLIAVNSTFNRVTLTNTTEAVFTNVSVQSLTVLDSARVEHYRWVQITVVDEWGDLLPGALVTIQPLVGGSSLSGHTGEDGRVLLRALSDVITSGVPSHAGVYAVNVVYNNGTHDFYADEDFISMPAYASGSIAMVLVTPTDNNGNERFLVVVGLEPDPEPADLGVSNVRFNLAGVIPVGNTVTIRADITNYGGTIATGAQALFYLDGAATPFATAGISSLAPGATTTITTDWVASTSGGQREDDRTINVVIRNVAGETILDNNEASAGISVEDSRPDVVFWGDIQIIKSGVSTNHSAAGEKVTITALAITSNGSPDAMAVKFSFYAENATGGRTLIYEATRDVLVGSTVTLTFEWTIDVPTGNYTIVAVANSDGLIDESNTANNEIYAAFKVDAPQPYVSLEPLDRDTFEPGANVAVRGKVTNQHTGVAINGALVSVDLYKDGVKVNPSPFTVNTAPDGTFIISVHIPETGDDGYYEIRVAASVDDKEGVSWGGTTVKAAPEGGAPWYLYVIILAVVSAVIIGFSAYLYKYGLGKMVECGECGALIPESSKRCPKCGVEFETGTAKCSKCGAWIAANSASCPDCGAKFITEAVEEEEDEYLKSMREQYESFVDTYREEAKKTLEKKYSDAKFPDWWKKQPTYVSFEAWLSQEEDKRKIGGVACPTCGILNPRGATICHKCGSLLEAKAPEPVVPAAEEKKPETAPAPKPLRRIVRRPVEKKPATPGEAKPEEAANAPAPEAPEAAKPEEPKPEEAKAAEEQPKPEEEKPSS